MSKFFPLPSGSEICVLPFNFVLERDQKNTFYYQRDVENYTDEALDLINMTIYMEFFGLYSGQNIHAFFFFYFLFFILRRYKFLNYKFTNSTVTGLCNFFFVPQDLIDRINSYFQRNLLLIVFYVTNFLPTEISSLH